MFKKTISIITILLLCCAVVLIVRGEGCFFAREQDLSLENLDSLDFARLETIKSERTQSSRSFLSFSYDGFDLPVYDDASGALLFCKQLSDRITIQKNLSCEIGTFTDETGVTILAYDRAHYRFYRVEWTTLPIVCLQTVGLPMGKSIDHDLCRGLVTVYDADTGDVMELPAMLRTRGESSLRYPKVGYLMRFLDVKSGGDANVSLPGFSENTQLALNSLYEDNTKIRDYASLSLWSEIRNTKRDPARAYAIDFVYAEVFVNGAYAGLYGLQESTNLASFGLAGAESVSLFKPDSHRIPQRETLPVSGDMWDEIKLEETTQEDPWTFLGSAFDEMFYREEAAFASGRLQAFDPDSCVDYTIWCNFLYASDNLWKNMLLITDQRDPANEKVFLVPWDSDQCLGLVWDSTRPLFVYEDADRAALPLIEQGPLPLGKLWAYDIDGFRGNVAARWFTLRQGVLREDALLEQLHEAFTRVTQSGARERDALRWPRSAQCTDNSFIESFVRQRLAYLDAFYAEYR